MDRKQKSILALGAVAIGTALYNALKPIKSNVNVVEPFDLNKYLGKWYEIARMPVRFEKNLSKVHAEYDLNEDGFVHVKNVGYSKEKQKWSKAIGNAKFARNENQGALKVSFFGPFYAGYNIVRIDKNYQYALVFGDNLDYLWILARETSIPSKIEEEYLDYARKSGYDIDKLIWTKH